MVLYHVFRNSMAIYYGMFSFTRYRSEFVMKEPHESFLNIDDIIKQFFVQHNIKIYNLDYKKMTKKKLVYN